MCTGVKEIQSIVQIGWRAMGEAECSATWVQDAFRGRGETQYTRNLHTIQFKENRGYMPITMLEA